MNIPDGISMPDLRTSSTAALRRDEAVAVGQQALHVVEPRDDEEVVRGVVEQRRLVPQPPVHGVRVRADHEIERVEVDVTRNCHDPWLALEVLDTDSGCPTKMVVTTSWVSITLRLRMISAQVALRQDDELPAGLRPRKKLKTRLAIEDAALALFDEHGYDATTVEQIAELAEVSTTTFFRYFPSKAEVVLSHYPEQLPALRQAIIDRPASESDLTAVRRALQSSWVEAIDAQRTARKARTIATSPLLRGLSFERGLGWADTLKDAARRNGAGCADPTRSARSPRWRSSACWAPRSTGGSTRAVAAISASRSSAASTS